MRTILSIGARYSEQTLCSRQLTKRRGQSHSEKPRRHRRQCLSDDCEIPSRCPRTRHSHLEQIFRNLRIATRRHGQVVLLRRLGRHRCTTMRIRWRRRHRWCLQLSKLSIQSSIQLTATFSLPVGYFKNIFPTRIALINGFFFNSRKFEGRNYSILLK